MRPSLLLNYSVQPPCSLCLCGEFCLAVVHHRGTENTEIAQRTIEVHAFNNILLLLLLISVNVEGKEPITVYLAGDSTMAQKLPEKRPETGWGEALQNFFKEDEVRIENHAQNGRSTRTFITEKRWQTIVDKLRKGDYVFIQFGHNDESKEKV